MLRIKVHPTELATFSVGCFLLGSYQLQQLLGGFGRMKKERARAFKIAKYSTSSACANANGGGSGKESLGLDLTNSLYNGERRSKNDLIFHTLGHQDELNAVIGIACEFCIVSNNGLQPMLNEIQSRLFDLGAAVATPPQSSSEDKIQYTKFNPKFTGRLEEWIDMLDAQLPPLTNFVLPSGGMSATHLNLARTVCRRAERSVIPLIENDLADPEVGRYLNRLSDFLFAAQRTAVQKEKKSEVLWVKSTEEF